MRRALVSILAALFIPHTALADAPLSRHTLPNGLEVVVAENHATAIVTVELAVREGAMTEDAAHNGLAHLYEHVFFKGNAVVANELAATARARALGLHDLNGTTGSERVNYYATSTADRLAETMEYLRDAIVSPRFDPAELAQERVVVTKEIDRAEARPSEAFWRAVSARLFWKYPTRLDSLGTRASVLAATPEKMRAIQRRYYLPNNTLLVVSGDARPADVFRHADALYASWARGPDPFVAAPVPTHPPLRASEVVLVTKPVGSVRMKLSWRGPATDASGVDDSYAGDVFGRLTTDPASRFQRALVDSGLCVSAWSYYGQRLHAGESGLDLDAAPDKAEGCLRAAIAVLAATRAPDAFTDDEIANGQRRLEIDRAERHQTTAGVAHDITSAWSFASIEYETTYDARVRAVTRADLARYLDRWIVGRPFVLGVMASEATFAAGLTKANLERAAGIGGRP